MASTSSLQMVQERGWRCGFTNFLRKELGSWWGTRKWWSQILIWALVLNLILVPALWVASEVDPNEALPPTEALDLFMNLFGAFATIGVMVLIQSVIVSEKRSGTAAWVMTSPVSRPAFILSKLVANALGVLATLVVAQGLIVYIQISLKQNELLPVAPFVTAMGLHYLHLMFYLALGLLLGTLFNSRGPVIGILLGVLIGQSIVTGLLSEFLPWLPLVMPESVMRMSVPVANGVSLPAQWPIPVLITAILSVVFVAVAILRFQREEF